MSNDETFDPVAETRKLNQLMECWDSYFNEAHEKWNEHDRAHPQQKISRNDRFSFPMVQLSNRQCLAVMLANLQYQVFNGGFDQYFCNGGAHEPGVLPALSRIFDNATLIPDLARHLPADVVESLQSFAAIIDAISAVASSIPRITVYDDPAADVSWDSLDHLDELFGNLPVNKCFGLLVCHWPEDLSPFHPFDFQSPAG